MKFRVKITLTKVDSTDELFKNHSFIFYTDNTKVLTSFHTLFARLHNFVVDKLLEINEHWNAPKFDDIVFEEARSYGLSLLSFLSYILKLKFFHVEYKKALFMR